MHYYMMPNLPLKFQLNPRAAPSYSQTDYPFIINIIDISAVSTAVQIPAFAGRFQHACPREEWVYDHLGTFAG